MIENEVLPTRDEINKSLKRGVDIFSPTFKLRGSVSIYYPKRHTSGKYFLGYIPSHNDFLDDYAIVYTLSKSQIKELNKSTYNVLDAIFDMFNRESNPLSTDAGQERIRTMNASHTSMSVGDIIKIRKTCYMVAGEGFKKLKWR